MSASHQFDEMNFHPTSRPTTNQINNQQSTKKQKTFVCDEVHPELPYDFEDSGGKKTNLAPPYRKKRENPYMKIPTQPLPGRRHR